MSKLKSSPKVVRVSRQLGSQVKRSRLARKLPQDLIAERARISLSTLKRIENGDPTVAMGSYLMVLLSLGILPEALSINDDLGEELLQMDARERAPRSKK
ncbi:helix-turn-helix domain-containing protein [Shewanella sp. H8]|uniref:helix-turn-helix domain-containing protein n=1 Tax=Shewanella sp. H8 TaxID=3342676 RepID=UPI0033161695